MLTLNPIFADRMIFQADKPIRIFGVGEGEIRAEIGELSVTTVAENGKFLLELPPRACGELADIRISDARDEILLRDVTFGDVYLFAGQSNMQFKLGDAKPDGELYESEEIRFFSSQMIKKNDRFTPEDGWVALERDSAPAFSAVAYYTARELHRAKKRPIGVISAYQGASIIESWLAPDALASLELDIPQSELHPDHIIADYSAWNRDSVLYGLDIEPLLPSSLAGVIWYQGESNTGVGDSRVYDRHLEKLVGSWREGFDDPQLPFVIVQIADFYPAPDWVDPDGWKRVQAAQARVCERLEGCKLAVSRDVCEHDDIHPPTKHKLAARIAELLAE